MKHKWLTNGQLSGRAQRLVQDVFDETDLQIKSLFNLEENRETAANTN